MAVVAVALAQPPLPEGNAPGRCGLALLRGLLAHGQDVRAVAAARRFAHAPDQYQQPPADLPLRVVSQAMTQPRTLVGYATALPARVRRPRGGLAGGAFERAVTMAAADADVLHLEEVETGWAALGSRVPRVLHVHYLTRLDRDAGRIGSSTWREVVEFEAAERRLVRRHRWLVASSPVVAAQLRRMTSSHGVVEMPMPFDAAAYPVADLDAPVAGLIGTMSWPPTRAAVDVLLGRVWPAVADAVPDALLHLAGRGSPPLRDGPPAGVSVLGEVASAAEFLCGLSVLLYPLPRGSGVKVKVLEAMACGVPVVTTPSGAEGAPASDGLIVANDVADFVSAATELLRDREARRQRGAAARADVVRRHSPMQATEPLIELYGSAVAGSR